VASFVAALFAILGTVFFVMAEITQGVETLVNHEYDITAASPVTAVRSPVRDEFLPAE
jgi:hypothetical protein